jgi:hypothetical protein
MKCDRLQHSTIYSRTAILKLRAAATIVLRMHMRMQYDVHHYALI